MKDPLAFLRNFVVLPFIILYLQSCSSPSAEKTAEEAKDDKKNKTHYVVITQMSFSPAEITVNKGDRLIFVNHDLVNHDITEAVSKIWASSVLLPEQEWEMTVTASADYYCSLHPVMRGKIVVR